MKGKKLLVAFVIAALMLPIAGTALAALEKPAGTQDMELAAPPDEPLATESQCWYILGWNSDLAQFQWVFQGCWPRSYMQATGTIACARSPVRPVQLCKAEYSFTFIGGYTLRLWR